MLSLNWGHACRYVFVAGTAALTPHISRPSLLTIQPYQRTTRRLTPKQQPERQRPHLEHLAPNLLELHLAATELQRQLHAVALAQELLRSLDLDLRRATGGKRPQGRLVRGSTLPAAGGAWRGSVQQTTAAASMMQASSLLTRLDAQGRETIRSQQSAWHVRANSPPPADDVAWQAHCACHSPPPPTW